MTYEEYKNLSIDRDLIIKDLILLKVKIQMILVIEKQIDSVIDKINDCYTNSLEDFRDRMVTFYNIVNSINFGE